MADCYKMQINRWLTHGAAADRHFLRRNTWVRGRHRLSQRRRVRFGLEYPVAREGIEQLRHVTLRHWLIQAVARLGLSARQMKASEQRIQERQLRGKVLVPGIAIFAVMPIVKFR